LLALYFVTPKASTVRSIEVREVKRRAANLAPQRGGQRLTPKELARQISSVTEALVKALARTDLSGFYDTFRTTDLPFLGGSRIKPQRLVAACSAILHRLGGISPAVGLAVENHLYIINALATFPTGDAALKAKRKELLDTICGGRLLVANTNSKVHADRLGAIGTRARWEGEGLRVEGVASYMSLSTQADLLFLLTRVEDDGPAVLIMPLRGNPEVEIGPLLFPRAMLDSDTRRVTFHNQFVPADSLLHIGNDELMTQLLKYQLTWHQGLLSALYLGAAARAIEEGRLFLRSVQGPGQGPLAELDGLVADMGRLAIRYRSARSLSQAAAAAIQGLTERPLHLAASDEVFDLACAAKQVSGRCAEEVVTQVRRIIGTRVFMGQHPLERLSQEVIFGPLGGEVDAIIERRIGRRILGEGSFLDHGW
jgi:alkylation response protein AidB-like acyl-CoA dehydrogenase